MVLLYEFFDVLLYEGFIFVFEFFICVEFFEIVSDYLFLFCNLVMFDEYDIVSGLWMIEVRN